MMDKNICRVAWLKNFSEREAAAAGTRGTQQQEQHRRSCLRRSPKLQLPATQNQATKLHIAVGKAGAQGLRLGGCCGAALGAFNQPSSALLLLPQLGSSLDSS